MVRRGLQGQKTTDDVHLRCQLRGSQEGLSFFFTKSQYYSGCLVPAHAASGEDSLPGFPHGLLAASSLGEKEDSGICLSS